MVRHVRCTNYIFTVGISGKIVCQPFIFLSLGRFRGCRDRWVLCQSFKWRSFDGAFNSIGARTRGFHNHLSWVHCQTCETVKASIIIICMWLKLKNMGCANDFGKGGWKAREVIWRLQRKFSVKTAREVLYWLYIFLII